MITSFTKLPIKVVIDRIGKGKFVWHELDAKGLLFCRENLSNFQRQREFASRTAIKQAIDGELAGVEIGSKEIAICIRCRGICRARGIEVPQ